MASHPDPICVKAYLPPARKVLSADQDEASLLLQLSAEDASVVLAAWPRLVGHLLYVTIIPDHELPPVQPGDLRRGGWGRKPKVKTNGEERDE